MNLLRSLMLIAIAMQAWAASAAALEAEYVRANLSGKTFEGTFRWDGNPDVQKVSIRLNEVTIDSSGAVAALGKGRYDDAAGSTSIDVKWLIDPQTMRFEMWELNPQGSTSFVTDGSHVGAISSDLKSINARWMTRSSGQRGVLSLTAR